MIWLLAIGAYAALVGVLTWLLRRWRPTWGKERVMAAANTPGPMLVVLGVGWAIARLGPAPQGETDATGMVLMIDMVGGAFAVAAMLAVGIVTSLLAWRLLRLSQDDATE